MAFSIAIPERPPKSRHGGFRPVVPFPPSTPRPENEMPNKDVPYRLPKLPKDGDGRESTDDMYKVWSRHGYDVYSTKPLDLMVMSSRLRPAAQEVRRSLPMSTPSAFPRFRQAMITPTQSHPKLYAGNVTDPAFYKNAYLHDHKEPATSRVDMSASSGGAHLPELHYDPTPTPIPGQFTTRSSSPAKSMRSIHWTLSPVRNHYFDKKGGGRLQGPYSREFTKKCTAPNNWMKMKWGRSKTTLV